MKIPSLCNSNATNSLHAHPQQVNAHYEHMNFIREKRLQDTSRIGIVGRDGSLGATVL